MRKCGTGLKLDRAGAYPSHKRLAAKPYLLGTPDHSPFVEGFVFQACLSCCVATNGVKRTTQIWHKIRGISCPMVSDLFVYDIGRRQEFAGMNPDLVRIADEGMFPEVALLAVQRKGVVPEDAYPGPASGPDSIWLADDQSLAQAIINTEPSPDLQAQAYDFRGLQFHEIDTSNGWYEAVDDCLMRGAPVTLAINADAINGSSDPGDRIVEALPYSGHNHCVTLLSTAHADYDLVGNSWHAPGAQHGGSWSWGCQSGPVVGAFKVRKGVLPRAAANLIAVDFAPNLPVQLRGDA